MSPRRASRRGLARAATLLALAGLLRGSPARAQSIRNHGDGLLGAAVLDTSRSTVTLQRLAVPDSARSTVTVSPAFVLADGVAASTIVATVLDASGRPVPGHAVTFASGRGGADAIVQPSAPTDANGVATGHVRSSVTGAATIVAYLPADTLALAQRPTVTFTRGLALRAAISADPERVSVGQVVTWTVTLANLTPRTVTPVWLAATLPPAFRYLAGSASRDGAPLADPAPGAEAAFVLDTVPAWSDVNGNGVPDPGEPGFVSLRFRTVTGSGAMTGAYVTRVLAREACPSCPLSNPAEASVQVAADPLFSLGTIVGRVYDDRNRDGREDAGEPGVANARVALDDGTVAVTDRMGLYHFPAVAAGHRLVAIDLGSLAGLATATSGTSRFVTITSGLLARADFGVSFAFDTVRVMRPVVPRIRLVAEALRDSVDLRGSVSDGSIVVNGTPVAASSDDARLSDTGLDERIRVTTGSSGLPLTFRTRAAAAKSARAWRLLISSRDGYPLRTLHGEGPPPAAIVWDGLADDSTRVPIGDAYRYQLSIDTRAGTRTSAIRMFGLSDSAGTAESRLAANAYAYPVVTSGVRVNDEPVGIDREGRYQRTLQGRDADTVRVRLADAHGRVTSATIPMPELAILSPRDSVVVHEPLAVPAKDAARLLASAAGGGGGVAQYALRGRTQPGNAIELDGVPLAVAPDGAFHADLDVREGLNLFGLVVRDTAGLARIVDLPVMVAGGDADSLAALALRTPPTLEVALPPAGAKLGHALVVSGRAARGDRVDVNGRAVEARPDGTFETTLTLPPGTSRIIVTATDSAGNVARIEREARRDDRLFLVALADGAVGRLQGHGFLLDRVRGGSRTVYTEGRAAYYLKGVVRGRYLVTSSYDSGLDEFAPFFDRLDAEDAADLVQHVDPDRYYPVYGDSSTLVTDAPRNGRFYLAIEGAALQATVGHTAIALDGGTLAGFRRTMDGMQVRWREAARTPGGEPPTEVALAGARARQLHVRDELRATGGSLYYLSHREVVAGSEHVVLAVRDALTGLVRARVPQQRGADYTLQWLDGRVLFTRPVGSVTDAGSLVSRTALAGDPVSIEIDYETRTEDAGADLAGARVQRRIGGRLALGGTYVHDALGAAPYTLQGADADLKLGRDSRVTLEGGSSRGAGARAYTSDDGGLTFAEGTPSPGGSGDAWRLAADLDAGAWMRAATRARVSGYAQGIDPGYAAPGLLSERGVRRGGAATEMDFTSLGRLALRFDAEQRSDSLGTPAGRSRLLGAQWSREGRRFGGGAELQSRDVTDAAGHAIERSDVLSGLLRWKLAERLESRLERQQSLAGAAPEQTALGMTLHATQALALDARAATGTLGRAAQGGAVLTLGGTSTYAQERLGEDRSGASHVTVVGSQAPFGAGSRVYTEHQWRRDASGPGEASLVGLQRLWSPAAGAQLSLSGEHGQSAIAGGVSTRTALAGGASGTTASGLRLASQDEVRYETGATDRVQALSANALEARLVRGVSLLGRWRWSQTRDRRLGRIEARFDEHGLGLALRPDGGGPVALARWTHQADVRPAAPGSPVTGSVMDVLALEGTIGAGRLEWTGKGAARTWRDATPGASSLRTHSALYVSRLNSSLTGPLGMGVEYRVLTQREAGDARSGFLNELTFDASRRVRVGAGFNFTSFSDDELSRNESSVRGWFLRLQGRY
jgi:uncharacterized repeat protein (TIGR01451 family)